MGVFDKIGGADVSQDSNPLKPDFSGTCKIIECKLVEKYDGTELMLINLEVVTQDGDGPHKIGEEVTHFLKVKTAPFLSNVKQFVSSTMGCDPDDVGAAEAERVVSDENPMAGYVIYVKTKQITTRQGNPFTKVVYGGQVEA